MPSLTRFILVLGFLCAFGTAIFGQTDTPAKFSRLTLEQGLSQSTVTCIAQDAQGFLWFGTGDGLNRYDGYNFKIFRRSINDPKSLSGNLIYSLYADPDGTLWIGTSDNGLNRFDPRTETFTRYQNKAGDPASLSHNTVYGMRRDRDGSLLVGTRLGLCRLDVKTGTFERFLPKSGDARSIGGEKVVGLGIDSKGVVWVGHENGLDRFDSSSRTFTRFQTVPGPNATTVRFSECTTLTIGRNDQLYFGTGTNGFVRFDPSANRAVHFLNDPGQPTSVAGGKIYSIVEDHNGRLWIGSYANGLDRLDPGSQEFRHYRLNSSDPESIGGNLVWAILEDRSGGLWVGTETGGVSRLPLVEPKFKRYLSSTGNGGNIQHRNVWAFTQGPAGTYLAATDDGLFSFNPVSGETRPLPTLGTTPPVSIGKKISALLTDRRGAIWIGEDTRLVRYDPATGKTEIMPPPPTISPDAFKGINWFQEDRAGRIWFGGGENGGPVCYDPERNQWKELTQEEKVSAKVRRTNTSFCFAEDGDKGAWIGFIQGLFRYDYASETLRPFPETGGDALPTQDLTVMALKVDSKGRLWVSFEGSGLSLYHRETKKFTTYTTREGLPNDVVYGILEDGEGKLWLTTNLGLSRFDPEKVEFRNYDFRDGLQSNEFNSNATFQSADGLLFVGGINGFNAFKPLEIRDNPVPPPVVLTGFRVMGETTPHPILDDLIELGYRDTNFSFDFAALNFNKTEKTRYAYKMEGFDRNWIESGTRRFAAYTNLNPGDYVFRVRGTNEDGIWNDKGATIRIRILPPPWATWWAYCLYFVAASGALVGAFRLQSNWVRDKASLNEARLRAESAEQLAQQNEELDRKNKELAKKNEELIESQRQADRIFSALAEALPGTTLDGKYRLEEKIGAGGFGVVFRAMHLALNRNIAVKVFKPIAHNDSAEAIERFKREGVSASRLNHPNIVTVLDSGVSQEGIAYIVMELLRGWSLKDELAKVLRLSVERSLRVTIQISNALAEAHRAGIIHRDIKPENIFLNVTPDGEVVKVVDFGVAKMVGAGSEAFEGKLTMTGGIIGTPVYMAPERLEGNQFDGRSDVYSLGVTLYEMLCGRPPFRTSEGNLWQIVLGHLKEAPPPPRKYAPNVPVEVENLILRALAKNPMSRPTAKEFFVELTTLAEQLKAIGFVGEPSEIVANAEPLTGLDEADHPTHSTRKFAGSVDRGLLPTESLSLELPGETPTLGSGESWSLSDLTKFPAPPPGENRDRRPSLS